LPHGLPFYLKRLITVVTSNGKELTSNYVSFTLNSDKPWPEGVMPLSQVRQWIANRTHPIYLITNNDHIAQLKNIALEQGIEVVNLDSNYWAALFPIPAGN
jgi:hypothetical protein